MEDISHSQFSGTYHHFYTRREGGGKRLIAQVYAPLSDWQVDCMAAVLEDRIEEQPHDQLKFHPRLTWWQRLRETLAWL